MTGGVFERPHGDSVAADYGSAYLARSDVRRLQPGQKFEVLCDDSRHYRAEIKYWIDQDQGTALLHFCHWSSAYDYKNSLFQLYIAPDGLYSAGMLTDKNTYVVVGEEKKNRRKSSASAERVPDKEQRDYFSNTKYTDDFLSKPRTHRRRSREAAAGGGNSNGSSDSESITKLARTVTNAQALATDVPSHVLLGAFLGGVPSPKIEPAPTPSAAVVCSNARGHKEPIQRALALTEMSNTARSPPAFPPWLLSQLRQLNVAASARSTRAILAQIPVSALPKSEDKAHPFTAANVMHLLEARASIDELLDSILLYNGGDAKA